MQKNRWWRNKTVYQIYPRSFQDSNNDGIGDLKGILSRIDYLKELGVDIIWLGPIFSSPNDDNGYDVSDYYSIMDEFGTMEDFEQLLDALHEAGMKVLLDIVVNHTSDEHPWYQESRKSRENPWRDYYIWRDPVNGGEPCNWESVFSDSVWNYDETTGQYVLHLYSKKQIDLNWENPKVRDEVYRLSRFWLDKGVDGFRLDTIITISKDMDFPDAPVVHAGRKYQPGIQYYNDGPKLHDYLEEYKKNVFDDYNALVLGEAQGFTPEQALCYLQDGSEVMDLAIQWEHIESSPGSGEKWDEDTWNMPKFRKVMNKWQTELYQKGWNCLYLSNHDQPRQVSRFGDTEHYWKESAKMLATCMHMMQGTPFVYQGEEIGMTNVDFGDISDYRCVETRNYYASELRNGTAEPVIMERIRRKSRDNGRTPMQWDDSIYAGFSKVEPWIGVNPNYTAINVQQERMDPDSIYHYYRKLLSLRKQYELITEGRFELVMAEHPDLFAYRRAGRDEEMLVICNFSGNEQFFTETCRNGGKLLISNYSDAPLENDGSAMRPYEARVYYWGAGETRYDQVQ